MTLIAKWRQRLGSRWPWFWHQWPWDRGNWPCGRGQSSGAGGPADEQIPLDRERYDEPGGHTDGSVEHEVRVRVQVRVHILTSVRVHLHAAMIFQFRKTMTIIFRHTLIPVTKSAYGPHGRSDDFLWGALFSSKKLTTFLVVTVKTG